MTHPTEYRARTIAMNQRYRPPHRYQRARHAHLGGDMGDRPSTCDASDEQAPSRGCPFRVSVQ